MVVFSQKSYILYKKGQIPHCLRKYAIPGAEEDILLNFIFCK